MTFYRPSGPFLKPDPLTPAQEAAGKAHMARVAQLPCLVCKVRPVEVHHVFHGRYGTRRASDFEVLPLCPSCHRTAPWSIHRDKKGWRDRHGNDFELLPLVADMLAGEAIPITRSSPALSHPRDLSP